MYTKQKVCLRDPCKLIIRVTNVLVKTDTGRADFIACATAMRNAAISSRLKIFHRGPFCHSRLILEFYQLSPFFTFFHHFSSFSGPSEDFSKRDGRWGPKKVKKGEKR